jgi:hypothetical protein
MTLAETSALCNRVRAARPDLDAAPAPAPAPAEPVYQPSDADRRWAAEAYGRIEDDEEDCLSFEAWLDRLCPDEYEALALIELGLDTPARPFDRD